MFYFTYDSRAAFVHINTLPVVNPVHILKNYHVSSYDFVVRVMDMAESRWARLT